MQPHPLLHTESSDTWRYATPAAHYLLSRNSKQEGQWSNMLYAAPLGVLQYVTPYHLSLAAVAAAAEAALPALE